MHKLNRVIISGLLIAGFGFGGILGVSQNASAADSAQDRQKQLEMWQQKLAEWQQAQQAATTSKKSSTSSSKTTTTTPAPAPTTTTDTSTAAPLPNTGPGQVTVIFTVAVGAGSLAHYTIRRQQLDKA